MCISPSLHGPLSLWPSLSAFRLGAEAPSLLPALELCASRDDPAWPGMAAEGMPTLPTLPEDLQHRILLQMDAIGLSRAACTCAHWRLVAQAAAEEQIAGFLPPFSRGLSNAPWIRALASSEHLTALLGPPPVNRIWRQEWKLLRMAQAELLAEQRGRAEQYALSMAMEGMQQLLLEAFEDESGGHLAVAREKQHHAGSIAHLIAQGHLEPDRAVAVALLLSLCSASLARALRTRDVAFAASTHLVAASMRWLALTAPPAPLLYANLHGECARHPTVTLTARRAPGCRPACLVMWRRVPRRRACDRRPRVGCSCGGSGPAGRRWHRRWAEVVAGPRGAHTTAVHCGGGE